MATTKRTKKQKQNLIITIVISLAFLSYLAVVLFGTHGFLTLTEKRNEKENLMNTIRKDSLKNVELKKRLEQIKGDPAYIEKIAREKYNMQKPGEKVFQIEKTDSIIKK